MNPVQAEEELMQAVEATIELTEEVGLDAGLAHLPAVRAAYRRGVVAEMTAWDYRGFKSWADTAFRNYEDDTGYAADSWRHIAMKLATKGAVLSARIAELTEANDE